MTQRMDTGRLRDAAGLQRRAEGALHAALIHRLRGRSEGHARVCRRWKEPHRMPMQAPILPPQLQGTAWQRYIAILPTFAVPNIEELAGTIHVLHVQVNTLAQAQATGINRRQTDAIARAVQAAQNLMHFLNAEDDR